MIWSVVVLFFLLDYLYLGNTYFINISLKWIRWASTFVKFFVPSRFYPCIYNRVKLVELQTTQVLSYYLILYTFPPKNTIFAFQGFACVLYFLYGKTQVKFKLQLIDRGQGRR